jgi:hypothetical protein
VTNLAPISGEVPPDYNGPIFYRTRVISHDYYKKPFPRHLGYENRDAARRFAYADHVQVAHRVDPNLFGENGNLLAVFRAPLKARLLSSAPKNPPEWAFGHWSLVSERIRSAIEELQPGKHLFIPIDVDWNGDQRRLYVFYVLRNTTRTILAMRANGIEFNFAETGNPVFPTPAWLASDRFAYLNGDVVDGAAVDFDPRVGIVMSKPLIDALGNVFPKGIVLVPTGVVDEPLESLQ